MNEELYYLIISLGYTWNSIEGVFNKVDNNSENSVYHPVNILDTDQKIKSININESSEACILSEKEKLEGKLTFIDNVESKNVVYLYGSSDDLIEIQGSIKDEYYYNKDGTTVNVNSTEVKYNYNKDAVWDVYVTNSGNATNIRHYEFINSRTDNFCEYSDLVVVEYDRDINISVD